MTPRFALRRSPSHFAGFVSRRRARGDRAARWCLGLLLAFGALNAFGGAFYGLAGAKGVPVEWLAGSPFTDYTIPSLILFVVVGGAFALAALAVLGRWPNDRRLAERAALISTLWIAVQVAIIGYVSWMQPATVLAAGVMFGLAQRLRR